MQKDNYYYNTTSLRYEKIETSWTRRIGVILAFVSTSFLFAFVIFLLFRKYVDEPKEKEELVRMRQEFQRMDNELNQYYSVLEQLRVRDANTYRVIYNADPISDELWNRDYAQDRNLSFLDGLTNKKVIEKVQGKLTNFAFKLDLQSQSYDELAQLINNSEDMLSSIPSIQPVSNDDLTRVASGYGWRIDPVYGTRRFHWGLDFTADIGSEIYATGDGVIKEVSWNGGGYGNRIIIDHGYGYKTHYAHLSGFNVYPGQAVVRGQVIGYVGNTGKSVGPHLHYEVIYKGQKVNPINFFYDDLDDEQYDQILDLAKNNGQTLD